MFKYASLTPDQLFILRDKGTEPPHYQASVDHARGTYLCRGCGSPLFRGGHEFVSRCGWPSFDDEIPGAIQRQLDADGRRLEIVCAHCEGHLGHVFTGEQLTAKNCRHCVNALAIEWVDDATIEQTEEALLAAGCFWGVEYWLARLPGVLKTEVGYMGGHLVYPTYRAVCQGNTGHVEAIRVVYDPRRLDYANLLRYFFEIHDPTQTDGQGPDIGLQYLSVIFYYPGQQEIAAQVRQSLMGLGYAVTTQLQPVTTFWPAEAYHQHYYQKNGQMPYCHAYQAKFR